MVTSGNQSVIVKDLKIIITPNPEYISKLATFSKALYACSPAEPSPTQNITSFNITSDTDLELTGQTLKAGENLNEIFFLTNEFNGEGLLSTYLQSSNTDASRFEYILTIFKTIAKNQVHQFKIEIALSDNQKFSLSTPSFELVP